MFSGHNFIGFNKSAKGQQKLKVFSTTRQDFLDDEFVVATTEEIRLAALKAKSAFSLYKKTTPERRAMFLETIADEMLNIDDELLERAALETGLPAARLEGERMRTMNQLKMFAAILREGSWVEAVIDTAEPGRKPLPRPDLRKMLYPVGPVVVFGASNFPFAFSTAGGDTASALAAGCPVIIKAHNAHLGTNELVAQAVINAAMKCEMPDGIFSTLIGRGNELGRELALAPEVKAIGFTGSYTGGMALFRLASTNRKDPIPVYAEMSSINPVVILPDKMKRDIEQVAALLANAITLGAGQFCTNPGLLFVIDNPAVPHFIEKLVNHLGSVPGMSMLTPSISSNYYTGREKMQQHSAIENLYAGEDLSASYRATAVLMEVNAKQFIASEDLKNEVFGPSSLIIRCAGPEELLAAIESLDGQLTGTVFGLPSEIPTYSDCIEALENKVGRIIYNGVPTGVEVCHAMVHGGPFPATVDGRTTSVGADAIKRFTRPVCLQDCPEELLPDALKDNNPLGIMRKHNGHYTRRVAVEEQKL